LPREAIEGESARMMMMWLLLFSHRRRCSRCRLMSLDSLFNVLDAVVPGLPVPAASKLSRNNMQNGGLEGLSIKSM